MKKTIALLALLAAFPPLSTDMYLAAIPLLVDSWQQPLATVNLTLIGFFVTCCGFLLWLPVGLWTTFGSLWQATSLTGRSWAVCHGQPALCHCRKH
jgi:hypothetical protein